MVWVVAGCGDFGRAVLVLASVSVRPRSVLGQGQCQAKVSVWPKVSVRPRISIQTQWIKIIFIWLENIGNVHFFLKNRMSPERVFQSL